MKKIIMVLLTVLTIASLVACTEPETETNDLYVCEICGSINEEEETILTKIDDETEIKNMEYIVHSSHYGNTCKYGKHKWN